jgi:hypothetical protein
MSNRPASKFTKSLVVNARERGKMPDFETRSPPEPSRLSKLHAYAVAALRRSIASVVAASKRLRTIAAGLLRSINRHRWAAGLVTFCVVVGSVGIPGFVGYRQAVTHPTYDQMPEYSSGSFDPADCPYIDFGANEGNIGCYYAITDARDPELLALVTADVAGDVAEVQVVKQVEFWESNPYSGDGTERPYATGLVFASKDAAQDSAAYIEEDLSEATYWHGAYVFEGDDYPL